MTEQSYLSFFTLTIGFIPISIKILFCNLDHKPMSLVKKLPQAISAVQGPFHKLFKTIRRKDSSSTATLLKFIQGVSKNLL